MALFIYFWQKTLIRFAYMFWLHHLPLPSQNELRILSFPVSPSPVLEPSEGDEVIQAMYLLFWFVWLLLWYQGLDADEVAKADNRYWLFRQILFSHRTSVREGCWSFLEMEFLMKFLFSIGLAQPKFIEFHFVFWEYTFQTLKNGDACMHTFTKAFQPSDQWGLGKSYLL